MKDVSDPRGPRPVPSKSQSAEAQTPSEVSRLTDHLFRQEAGKLVSVITRIFGVERLQLAEDVVQEALVRALRTWPFYGIPKNPAAWLTQTAKNLALDVVRREKLFLEKQPEIISTLEHEPSGRSADETAVFEHELKDDRLRLMFACCHPLIPQESQTALALKTLCGLSAAEIANAFLTSEAAIAKRLTRARQRIREQRIPFEIPAGAELPGRLDAVLRTLYLLFNEGYKASSGESLVREELCQEAIRLTTLLTEHPVGRQPRVHALAALMLLNAARLPTRTTSEGSFVQMKDQDRVRWDRGLIGQGMRELAESAVGGELSEYHLQAGIAACHCAAADYAATNWEQILALYDRLVDMDDSPVIALNRAVALARVRGAQAGIAAVMAIRNLRTLDSYHLRYAVLAEFETELEHYAAAAGHLRKAIELTEIQSEQALLTERLRECEAHIVKERP